MTIFQILDCLLTLMILDYLLHEHGRRYCYHQKLKSERLSPMLVLVGNCPLNWLQAAVYRTNSSVLYPPGNVWFQSLFWHFTAFMQLITHLLNFCPVSTHQVYNLHFFLCNDLFNYFQGLLAIFHIFLIGYEKFFLKLFTFHNNVYQIIN